METYRKYSDYLVERFGEKVYKLPIKLPITCPNRSGVIGRRGCTFCGDEGGSFENLESSKSIQEQIIENKNYISPRYGVNKFIVYYQNFTNTFVSFEFFKNMLKEAFKEDIVGINISTRPDCVTDEQLDYLLRFQQETGLEITLELGLQTVNPQSLKKICRGHGVAEYVDCVLRAHRRNLRVSTHLILNLPWDTDEDAVEAAKLVSSLRTQEVKIHSLYVLKNTVLAEQFQRGEFEIISADEFEERVILFLQYLDPKIVIGRLLGRAPKENTIFCNWGRSWWSIRDSIEEKMKNRNIQQGDFSFLRKPIVFLDKVK